MGRASWLWASQSCQQVQDRPRQVAAEDPASGAHLPPGVCQACPVLACDLGQARSSLPPFPICREDLHPWEPEALGGWCGLDGHSNALDPQLRHPQRAGAGALSRCRSLALKALTAALTGPCLLVSPGLSPPCPHPTSSPSSRAPTRTAPADTSSQTPHQGDEGVIRGRDRGRLSPVPSPAPHAQHSPAEAAR